MDCGMQTCLCEKKICCDLSVDPTDKATVALPACKQSNFCQTSADEFMGNKEETKQADFERAHWISLSLITIMYVTDFLNSHVSSVAVLTNCNPSLRAPLSRLQLSQCFTALGSWEINFEPFFLLWRRTLVYADTAVNENKGTYLVIKQSQPKRNNKESWDLVNSSVQIHKKDIISLVWFLLLCQTVFYVWNFE